MTGPTAPPRLARDRPRQMRNDSIPDRGAKPKARRAVVLRRLYAVLQQHDYMPLDLAALCRATGTPPRTLAWYCRSSYGMGPIRYLRLRRLHFAHEALLQGDPAATTVTAVATRFGFMELGRFAAEYRAQFGEPPSETLRRGSAPPGRAERPPTQPSAADRPRGRAGGRGVAAVT